MILTRASAALVAASTAIATALVGANAGAQPAKEFYAGRQIKLVVGSAGGGGYEFYSRLLGRHMSRHLPGNPLFIVQVMPGAAGVIAANYLYNIAPRDGSEIGMVGRAVATQPLLDPTDPGPRYVATRFNWIGSPQQEVGLIVARTTSAVRTPEDLRAHELVVSGTSPASPPSYYPRLFNRLLGTRFKVVDGYASSQTSMLALERGEVDGHVSGSSSAAIRNRIAPLVSEGKLRIVAQIGLARDPDYPEVPLILDLARQPVERQLLELVLTQQAMAWPIVTPPDVPTDRVKALREAFDAAIASPELLKDAAAERLVINPVGGEALHKLLERVYATPREMLDQLAAQSAKK